ncbi:MAG: hydroxyethylthiazole kinase [Aerococcus sp.]|nr:hydroxyethylthiazole kinase [Aerococcus sp.]
MTDTMIQSLRHQRPVVVNYANFVTPFLVANGLNAIGASPIMSEEQEEAHDLVQIAKAVVINAGAVRRDSWPLMQALATSANERNIPLVLDPVAVGATRYRKELNTYLLKHYHFTAIRGNVGEIATLADIPWHSQGIDAGEGNTHAVEVVTTCAQKYQAIAIASGKVDYISDGTHTLAIHNQTELLPTLVGSGDLLSSMVGAYQSVCSDPLAGAKWAILHLTIAGEQAATSLHHQLLPGQFYWQLLDQLSVLTDQTLHQMKKVEVLS